MTNMAASPEAVWSFAEHEHRELTRGLHQIHDVACEINAWVLPELPTHVLGVLTWLDHALEPHMAWEEGWLYPQIDARTGTLWATRSARFDHQQIRELASRLREDERTLRAPDARDGLAELRCHLFSLEALLRSHIEREERFLIPLLADGGESVAPTSRPMERA